MTDHYAVLGVPRTASTETIRRAYREGMRSAHPDSGSPSASSAERVTRISEAWRVLSSPERRAAYDRQLSAGSAAGAVGGVRATGAASPLAADLDRPYPPARFPWRFVLTVIGVGAAILVFLHIIGDPMPPRGIDGLVNPGSCLDFDNLGAAFEVPCDGPHQAVARELVPFGSPCDSDTTQARDRQGMGTVCIEP